MDTCSFNRGGHQVCSQLPIHSKTFYLMTHKFWILTHFEPYNAKEIVVKLQYWVYFGAAFQSLISSYNWSHKQPQIDTWHLEFVMVTKASQLGYLVTLLLVGSVTRLARVLWTTTFWPIPRAEWFATTMQSPALTRVSLVARITSNYSMVCLGTTTPCWPFGDQSRLKIATMSISMSAIGLVTNA